MIVSRLFKNGYLCFSIIAATIILIIIIPGCTNTNDLKGKEVSTLIEHLYGGTGGLTVGPDDQIYASDFGPWLSGVRKLDPMNRVYRISKEGDIEVFAEGFYGASGSKFDKYGNFYQSNVRKGIVSRIPAQGVMDTNFIEGLTSPVGITLDNNDNIYINNCDGHKIIRVDPDGNKFDFCTDSLLNCPNGLTMDNDGNFYVSNFYDGNLIKINAKGEASLLANIPGNNNGHVLYHDQNLYVVARAAHQIYKVSLDGNVEVFAGTGTRGRNDGSRLKASFSFPNDIDISLDGEIMYLNEVSDTISDHRVLTPMSIRKIKMH